MTNVLVALIGFHHLVHHKHLLAVLVDPEMAVNVLPELIIEAHVFVFACLFLALGAAHSDASGCRVVELGNALHQLHDLLMALLVHIDLMRYLGA